MSRPTAREHIYHSLCDWIIDGTLQPGEKISDAEIAEYFGVSRTPAREAVQMLAANKLVQILPGKETRVTEIDREETREAYSMLAILHCAALAQAFPVLDAACFAELRAANAAFEKAAKSRNLERTRECDKRFHALFVRLAHNRFLADEAEVMLIHVLRVENLHDKHFGDRAASVREHAQIIEAAEAGDLAAASDWMRRNWEHFGSDIDELQPL